MVPVSHKGGKLRPGNEEARLDWEKLDTGRSVRRPLQSSSERKDDLLGSREGRAIQKTAGHFSRAS